MAGEEPAHCDYCGEKFREGQRRSPVERGGRKGIVHIDLSGVNRNCYMRVLNIGWRKKK